MSEETLVVIFRLDDGVITSAVEMRGILGKDSTTLIARRDIEDAVARVANAPVGGREELSKEKP